MKIIKLSDDELDCLVKVVVNTPMQDRNYSFGRLLITINEALKSNEKAA